MTFVFYCIALGLLGKICSCLLPIENMVFTNLFLIHFEVRSFWKILESRVRSPEASMQRKIIGDLAKVYYSPVLFELLISPEPDLWKFVVFLPKFFILELSVKSIADETFNWVYGNNKVTRTFMCLMFSYFMCGDYMKALEYSTELNIAGLAILVVFLTIDFAQSCCISQINLVEDLILLKFAKVKKEISFQSLLTDAYVFVYLNIATLGFMLFKINAINTALKASLEDGPSLDSIPTFEIYGVSITQIEKAVYLLILFLPT